MHPSSLGFISDSGLYSQVENRRTCRNCLGLNRFSSLAFSLLNLSLLCSCSNYGSCPRRRSTWFTAGWSLGGIWGGFHQRSGPSGVTGHCSSCWRHEGTAAWHTDAPKLEVNFAWARLWWELLTWLQRIDHSQFPLNISHKFLAL